jgi:MFS family permease
MATGSLAEGRVIETDIPARLDRLPWARWHWMVLIGLGTVWILDGLEVTIVGTISSRLTEKGSGIAISTAQIGQAAAIYVAGACVGALFFGWLADRMGRKRLFLITLALYLVATVGTAFSQSFLFFAICRFFTGAGIGGEYAAINSAIDELIPARVRGTVDLIINGSFWLGTAAGAALSILLLDDSIFAKDFGWRLAFGLGAVLGIGILIVRRHVPESPRWMFIHGKAEEADALVTDIERDVRESAGVSQLKDVSKTIKVREQERVGFIQIAKTVFGAYPRRTVVGLALFIGQAFLYNAVFFTYALVLGQFYGVKPASVGLYIIPFAIGNFLGPLVLGRLFDSVGRKPMIAGTYILSGALLVITAFLFKAGTWTAETQTAAWCVIFFFASAGASAAYLTVSEIFPMETRALAIAFFYAVGTAIGGITGPLLFGKLVETGKETNVFWGYILGAALMIVAGIVQALIGIEAARKNLEDVATPLAAEAVEDDEPRPRRHRFGPSESGLSYSPVQQSSSRVPDEDIDEEVAALAEALRGAGPEGLDRSTLGRQVNCRLWGPGRYRRALSTALARGEISQSARGRFVAEREAVSSGR